jgi:CRP-like cAMP-binding protein
MNEPMLVSSLLLIGFCMKIAGFLVRDEILLRALVAAGLCMDALFYLLRAEPVYISVGANATLVVVNVALIIAIVLERTTFTMRQEDILLMKHFPTLNPGQFRRLRKMMREDAAPPGSVLTYEHQPVPDLMFVFADRIVISKGDDSFPIAGPSFIGEIAFLTGQRASAHVMLPEGGLVLRMDSSALHARMARSPALNNAMVALFGDELARKVADSVPMPHAAHPRATPAEPAATGAAASKRTAERRKAEARS